MREIQLIGSKIKVYASVKEMPVRLYNTVQRYLLQDSGIGADINAVDSHFEVLDSLLSAGKIEEARRERVNLRYNLFMMLEGLDFKSSALACFIHSVDDQPVTDYSEEALLNLIGMLSENGLTMGMVEDLIAELKKNSNLN